MLKNKIVNFFLNQASYLRCMLPLAAEASKRNYIINFYVQSSGKYNDIMLKENLETLSYYANLYGGRVLPATESKKNKKRSLSFFVEGVMLEKSNPDDYKVVITSTTDFSLRYFGGNQYVKEGYIEKVDRVIFPSEEFAKTFRTINKKNMYYGLPKYDIVEDVIANKAAILKKYKLEKINNEKIALLFYPRLRDHVKLDIRRIIKTFKEKGYYIIVKSRGKDRPSNYKNLGDVYFEDISYYPHTSLELLAISDIVINFSSSAIKECVMFQKPVINFDIKPFPKILKSIYDYDFCIEMIKDKSNFEFSNDSLIDAISKIENKEKFEYDSCIKKYFTSIGNSSKKIFNNLDQYF